MPFFFPLHPSGSFLSHYWIHSCSTIFDVPQKVVFAFSFLQIRHFILPPYRCRLNTWQDPTWVSGSRYRLKPWQFDYESYWLGPLWYFGKPPSPHNCKGNYRLGIKNRIRFHVGKESWAQLSFHTCLVLWHVSTIHPDPIRCS